MIRPAGARPGPDWRRRRPAAAGGRSARSRRASTSVEHESFEDGDAVRVRGVMGGQSPCWSSDPATRCRPRSTDRRRRAEPVEQRRLETGEVVVPGRRPRAGRSGSATADRQSRSPSAARHLGQPDQRPRILGQTVDHPAGPEIGLERRPPRSARRRRRSGPGRRRGRRDVPVAVMWPTSTGEPSAIGQCTAPGVRDIAGPDRGLRPDRRRDVDDHLWHATHPTGLGSLG